MRYREEDLEEIEISNNPGIFARLATLLVLVLLGVAVYMYLNSGGGNKNPDSLPLITEDHPPEKIKPDNPGGMEIPDQDASVYNHLDKDSASAEPEKLMPSAEAPVNTTTPPSTPASLPDSLPAAPEPDKTPAAEAAPPPAAATAQDAAALSQIVKQATADLPARIQLGAVGSEDSAKVEWARIKTKYGDELKGLDSHFSEVNLGDKGAFVRIQTETISQADAEVRCQKLKLENQACMVVKASQ